jgi:mRNA interferase RelE/StbE
MSDFQVRLGSLIANLRNHSGLLPSGAVATLLEPLIQIEVGNFEKIASPGTLLRILDLPLSQEEPSFGLEMIGTRTSRLRPVKGRKWIDPAPASSITPDEVSEDKPRARYHSRVDRAAERRDAFQWTMHLSPGFKKDVSFLDQKMKGRVLEALMRLAEDPIVPAGDTVKPLTGDLKGMWRVRIGGFRLVNFPTQPPPVVNLLTVAARGDIYD